MMQRRRITGGSNCPCTAPLVTYFAVPRWYTDYAGFGAMEFDANQVWANWQTCASGQGSSAQTLPERAGDRAASTVGHGWGTGEEYYPEARRWLENTSAAMSGVGLGAMEFDANQVWANWQTCAGG